MLTKEISEVEKEIEDNLNYIKENEGGRRNLNWVTIKLKRNNELEIKLSTLKSAQAKFNKFEGEIKQKVLTNWKGQNEFIDFIDELSSKQEGS